MDPFKFGLKGNQNEDLCKYNLHQQVLFGEPINSYTKEALIKVICFKFELHRCSHVGSLFTINGGQKKVGP